MYTEVQPLGRRLVVLPIKEDEILKSGLFIPSGGKGDAFHGRVVSVGKGYCSKNGKHHRLEYNQGDVVLYGRGAGEKVDIGDFEHLILGDEDVLATYKGAQL